MITPKWIRILGHMVMLFLFQFKLNSCVKPERNVQPVVEFSVVREFSHSFKESLFSDCSIIKVTYSPRKWQAKLTELQVFSKISFSIFITKCLASGLRFPKWMFSLSPSPLVKDLHPWLSILHIWKHFVLFISYIYYSITVSAGTAIHMLPAFIGSGNLCPTQQ